jgi:DNA-binding beta-propeller fold protein YncE
MVSSLAIIGETITNAYRIIFDSTGNLYVIDGNTIKKLVWSGSWYRCSVFAGQTAAGFADGLGAAAKFNSPQGITADNNGNIYVADTLNFRIRKIDTTGNVTTFAGTGITGSINGTRASATFITPTDIIIDSQKLNLYVADNSQIRKINISSSEVTTVASGFLIISGITMVPNGNLYVSDRGAFKIFRVARSGESVVIAGTGSPGSGDGAGLSASFYANMRGITSDYNGNLYVLDSGNGKIRLITRSGNTYTVTTLAGNGTNAVAVNGAANTAVFQFPSGAVVDTGGNVYVADTTNKIRVVSSINPGTATMTLNLGEFKDPGQACIDSAGNIYVTDLAHHIIKKCTPDGGCSILAGSLRDGGWRSSQDGRGSAATFTQPFGICVDSTGNLYVTENINKIVRKITPDGDVSTIVSTSARLQYPRDVLIDSTGTTLYVLDQGNNCIKKFSISGSLVSTLPHILNAPKGLCIDAAGNLYVCDTGNNKILKITPEGSITTVAGNGTRAITEGIGTASSFSNPKGICIDPIGNIYFTASNNPGLQNNILLKMTPNGNVTKLSENVGYNMSSICIDPMGNLYVCDFRAVRKITINPPAPPILPINFIPADTPFRPPTEVPQNPVSGINDPPYKYTAPTIKLSGGTRKKRRASR